MTQSYGQRTAVILVARFEDFLPSEAESTLGLVDLLANPRHILRLLRQRRCHSFPAAELTLDKSLNRQLFWNQRLRYPEMLIQ